jgi:hypothetical protein
MLFVLSFVIVHDISVLYILLGGGGGGEKINFKQKKIIKLQKKNYLNNF